MSTRFAEFNGLVFGGASYIDRGGGKREYTPYLMAELLPDEVETSYQQDDLITDGAVFSNFRYGARLVSLRGYILPRRGENLAELRQRLYTKLNGKKTSRLRYFDGTREFFCSAFGTAPVCAAPKGQTVEFNINFTVPDFFWYESKKTVLAVASVEKKLSTPFTLPMSFSSRTARSSISNENEFEIYPKLTFIAKNVTEAGSIFIRNLTTGSEIVLSGIEIPDGTQIEIDCATLTAINAESGESIINSFNDFSDFALAPGENLIECTDTNGNAETCVSVEYYKPFVGV